MEQHTLELSKSLSPTFDLGNPGLKSDSEISMLELTISALSISRRAGGEAHVESLHCCGVDSGVDRSIPSGFCVTCPRLAIPPEITYNPVSAGIYMDECGGLPPLPKLSVPTIPQPAPSYVGYDESTGIMFVNGMRFHIDDHEAALESQKALDWPPTPMPPGFRAVSPGEYKGYLYRIEHPVQAYIDDIKRYFRKKGKDYQRMKKKIEAAVAQCFAIADNNFPGDPDAASDYKDDCIDNLPWAKGLWE